MSTPVQEKVEPRSSGSLDARFSELKGKVQPFVDRTLRFLAPAPAFAWRFRRPVTLALLTASSVFVLLPNGFYRQFTGGQDPHWHLALCIAFKQGWVFGRDIVFTYGPLGFLEGRSHVKGIKVALELWDLSLYGVLGWVLYRVYARLQTGTERVTTLLHVIGIGVVRTAPGTHLILPLELYFLFAHLNEKRRERLWLALATLCAVVGLYVKVGTGILGVTILFAYLAYRIAVARPRSRSILEAAAAALLVALSFPLLRVAPIGYLKASLELGSGYTAAMGTYDARQAQWITVALFLVATLLVGVLAGARRLIGRREELLQALLVLVSVFVYFKQGFVRVDERHFLQFFRFGPLAAFFFYLYGEPEVKRMLRTYLAFAVAACVALAVPGVAPERLKARYEEIKGYLSEAGSLEDTAPVVPRHIPRLPQAYVNKIGRASVDVVPHDLALAVHHQLHYTPRPLIQSYAAFTPYLDELDAKFFRGAKAPRFVVYSHSALENPQYAPWWTEPRMKLSLLERYEVAAAESDSLLLALRPHAWSVKKGRSWTGTWQLGKPLPVPTSSGLVLVAVHVKSSFSGTLARFFYRPAPLSLEVRGGSRTASATVVPAHLGDGLLVNRFVEKQADVKELFIGELSHLTPVEHLRVISGRPSDYRPEFAYEFNELLVNEMRMTETEKE